MDQRVTQKKPLKISLIEDTMSVQVNVISKKRKFSNSKQETDEEDVMKQLQNENQQLKKRIEVLETLQQTTKNSTSAQIQTTQEIASTSNVTTQNPADIMQMIKKELSSGFTEIKENGTSS